MFKPLYLLLILGFLWEMAIGQDKPQYAVSLIPDTLKKNVNSILREEIENLTISSPGKGTMEIKRVITVLNEKDEEHLTFYDYFDKFRKIDDVEINIYDANGRFKKSSRKRDLHQQSTWDGFSLVTDGKILYAQLRTDVFPITIEINYEVNFDGMLEYDDFTPQYSNMSIQHKAYSITVDSNNKVRFKNYKCAIQPTIRKKDSKWTYFWEVSNIYPLHNEPGSSPDDYPHVMISPTYFVMDDYQGNMTSWKSFGAWQTSLIKETNQLPVANQSFYKDLVKGATSEREKVSILYKY